jgi:hypothetical protein
VAQIILKRAMSGTSFDENEIRKCVESPAYFYNNYVKVIDEKGNKVDARPTSQSEFDEINAKFDLLLKRRAGGYVKSNFKQ